MDQPDGAGEDEGRRWEGKFRRLRRVAVAVAGLTSYVAGAQPPGFQIEVKPLSREQVEAFYGARGFRPEAIGPYADACALSFTLRNVTAKTIRYRLADWRAGDLPFAAIESWDEAWENSKVSQSARIAFRWAQLPPEQEFAPGDWIMGMAALAARPKGPFRITARYRDERGAHEAATQALSCAD